MTQALWQTIEAERRKKEANTELDALQYAGLLALVALHIPEEFIGLGVVEWLLKESFVAMVAANPTILEDTMP